MQIFNVKQSVHFVFCENLKPIKRKQSVAKHASGAIAYYFRFDPAIADNQTGLFYSKTKDSDENIAFEPTDISLYDKEDTEHVGWFWQPYEAGKPIWMLPYHNQNNNFHMISYVIPLYHQEKFIGVVGIDFDYAVLAERVNKIKIYENGFAHLENYEDLFVQLDTVCANTFIKEKSGFALSIARGFAMFDADKDLCFNDVFKRADTAMY